MKGNILQTASVDAAFLHRVGEAADQSVHRTRIKALVLDGPVINWIDVLAYQARLNRIPEAVGRV